MFNRFQRSFLVNSKHQFNFSTFLFKNKPKRNILLSFQKFFFNQPTPAGGQTPAPAGPPPKTKEQLKVEKLMEQWPEWLRNAPNDNMVLGTVRRAKERLYKYHQGDRNYLKDSDLPHDIFEEVSTGVCATFTTDTIASLFQEYEGYLTDHWIMGKFFQIAITHKDLTPEFFQVILPQVKETLKKADKTSNTAIYLAGYAASAINLHDKEFWEIYEYKLIKERLHRYLTIDQIVDLVSAMTIAEKGSDAIFKLFEVALIKHRRYISLKPRLKLRVLQSYRLRASASKLLEEALENPNIEIPAIDPQIPLMSRPLHQGLSHETNEKPKELPHSH